VLRDRGVVGIEVCAAAEGSVEPAEIETLPALGVTTQATYIRSFAALRMTESEKLAWCVWD